MKKKFVLINILILLLLFMKTANAACTSGVFAIYKTDNTLLKAFKVTKYNNEYGLCVVDSINGTCTISKTETNSSVSDTNYVCYVDNKNNRVCTYKDYFTQTSCPATLTLSADIPGAQYLLKDSSKPGDNNSYTSQYASVKSDYIVNNMYIVKYSSGTGSSTAQTTVCSATYNKETNYAGINAADPKNTGNYSFEVKNGKFCGYKTGDKGYCDTTKYGDTYFKEGPKGYFAGADFVVPSANYFKSCAKSVFIYYVSSSSAKGYYLQASEVGCANVKNTLKATGASDYCEFIGKFTTATPTVNSGNTDSTTNVVIDEGPDYDEECGLLGDPEKEGTLANYAQLLFDIVKYVGIIACVALTIFDFAKGLFSEEQELPKNLTKKLTTRLILAISLFFLPILIKFILYFIGVYGSCTIK